MRLLLFLLFPAVELYLLVKVGGMIGALNMVLWVFASAVLGLWAVKVQGQDAMIRVRADLAEGKVPQNPFLEGLLLFLGGVLLILPGIISDAAGLILLVPLFRRLIASRLGEHLISRQAAGPGSGSGGASRIIFFRSSGFPGTPPQGPYGPGASQGPFGPGASQGPFEPHGAQSHPAFEREEQGPRQATIIESTAIDITDTPESPDNDAPDGADRKE